MGVSSPPQFATRKMKKTTMCTVRRRLLLARSTGRIKRTEAPVVPRRFASTAPSRSEEHTSELQSQSNLVCRLLLEKKKNYTCRKLVPIEMRGVSAGDYTFLGAQSYGASFSLAGPSANGGVFGATSSRQASLEADGS